MSGLLQVSTVFDGETESGGGLDDNNSKVRTWCNQIQYHREEPVVVVSKEVEQQSGMNMSNPRVSDNFDGVVVVDDDDDASLVLPVRDLKTRVYDNGDVIKPMDSTSRSSPNLSSSSFGSSRFSNNYSRARHDEDFGDLNLGEDFEKDKVVLRSPIPWRSRSGRMEMKGELERPPFYSLPPMEEAEIGHAFNPNFRNSLPKRVEAISRKKMHHRTSSPPPHLLSRSLLSTELEANAIAIDDDVPRKKVPYMTSSPPPAPPPLSIRKSPPMNERARLNGDGIGSSNFHKDYRQSYACETKNLSRTSPKEVLLRRANSEREVKPRTQMDSSAMVRSVRTFKTQPDMEEMIVDQRGKEMEPTVMDKTGRKMVGSNDALIPPQKQKQNHISVIKMSSRTLSDFRKERIAEFPEKYIVESGNEGGDDNGSALRNNDVAPGIVGDAGPDVDKKADEFIAKFREQIRLQKMESIKRPSGHPGRSPLQGKH